MAPIARAAQPARSITGMEPLVPPEPMPATMAAPAMPVAKTTGPNPREDILAGKVAPPEWKDYKPQHVGVGRKILGTLGAIGEGVTTRNIPASIGAYKSISQGPQLENFREAQQSYRDTLGEAELGEKTKAAETKQALEAAQTNEANARAQAALHPEQKEGLTPEETTIHDLMTGDNGKPRLNPDTQKPYSYLEAFQAVKQSEQDVKPGKEPGEQEKAISDWLGAHNLPDTPANRTKARQDLKEKPQQPQRELVEVPQPDGSTKLIEARPGMTLPKGAHKAGTKGEEATADEKRRADLAENMNENLDQLEEIANRRPDLFGPVAGRVTQLKGAVGTDDPDVAALQTIREQLGMAMVGAHAMRNAQHVGAAANAIINNFHNSPKAMLQAIKEARSSVGTFQEDVEHPRAPGTPREPGEQFTGKGPAVGTVEGGFRFKGGDPADQNNWEKVKEKAKKK